MIETPFGIFWVMIALIPFSLWLGWDIGRTQKKVTEPVRQEKPVEHIDIYA
jgi:hypothetical protein